MVARYAIGRILTRTLQKANMRLANSSTMPQLWYEYVLNSFLTAIAHLRGQKTKKYAKKLLFQYRLGGRVSVYRN